MLRQISSVTLLSALLSLSLVGCGKFKASGGDVSGPNSGQGNELGSVNVSWDPVQSQPNAILAGYRVFYGFSSRNYIFSKDVGMNTSVRISDLQRGATYYFAVVAYTDTNLQSDYSNEASTEIRHASLVHPEVAVTVK